MWTVPAWSARRSTATAAARSATRMQSRWSVGGGKEGGLCATKGAKRVSNDLQQQYLDAIKANAEVAILNTTLQTDLIDAEAEASALRHLATELVVELRIARSDAYGADVFDLASSVLDNRRAGQPLLEEVARLRAQLADLSRDIGEQNTTIGYQDAMLDAARRALDQIDRHVVGACESAFGGLPEPCEECGEMREIASQALAAIVRTE
jgi:hypothetical protein